MRNILAVLCCWILRLRYSVAIKGLNELARKKGVLILPNHPAEIDPVILISFLWTRLRPRPVVLEKFHHLPGAGPLMRAVRAIPIPDLEVSSGAFKRRRIERTMDEVACALNAGENVLFYPSGRLMTSGVEKIGGNSGAATIVSKKSDVEIVLVRTRGLYGSSFSKAQTGGRTPDFWRTTLAGLWILMKNLIFFTPRRKVEIEIEPAPRDFPRQGDPLTVNKWLENWYNRLGEEQPALVSRVFWREDLPQFRRGREEALDLSAAPPEIVRLVIDKISEIGEVPADKISLDQRLGDDLGLDSLNIAELLTWLNEQFSITDVEMPELSTVGAVVQFAAGRGMLRELRDAVDVPVGWEELMESRPAPQLGSVNSIPEAFLACCERMGTCVAAADAVSGVLTYKRLKIAALLFASRLSKLPGSHIGIMLPASVGASLTSMAAMLAGKTPVMINWTAGRQNIEHAVKLCRLEVIVTSMAFLDQIEADLSYLSEKFFLLEDMRRSIGTFEKLGAAMRARRGAKVLLRKFKIDKTAPHDTAVVLFTSGSEAAPKGVPLTHRNILSNIQGAMDAVELVKTDIIYGFLPPFHSFGLTVTTILPLVIGLKAAYHPNPNESRKLALGCSRLGVTLAAGTPTFLRAIINAGDRAKFRTMRLFISGAEKAPEELFQVVESLGEHVRVVEGYGISECSPIVTAGRPNQKNPGVGWPIGDVELLIVHHETLRPVPAGERGLILIRGSNVFSGYLGGKPDPFVKVNDKVWYNSGDLGFIQEGCLVISGRLKRFVKIAGEMVSLPAVEEALLGRWSKPATDGPSAGPSVAIVARELEDGARPMICLFTTLALSLEQANQTLKEAGFPNLVRISQVIRRDELPVLGSGKVDILSLKNELPGG